MRPNRLILSAAVLAGTSIPAWAQCPNPTWLPGDGVAGTNLFVASSVVWDPDGAGPIHPKVVIGGRFDIAGNAQAANIAAWDTVTGEWSAIGGGIAANTTSVVYSLAVLPNGHLVAGGDFIDAGGTPVSLIAEFDGTAWQSLGSGILGGDFSSVRALAVLPNGHLVAGGDFIGAGSVISPNVAEWDGSNWVAMGDGLTQTLVKFLFSRSPYSPTGDLVAGGRFTASGSTTLSNVARWNGTSWNAMGAGTNVSVRSLAVAPNGNLIAGGNLTTADGQPANRIARWNSTTTTVGNAWSSIPGIDLEGSRVVHAVTTLPNGDIIAAGSIVSVNGGTPVNAIARYNGTSWSPMGSGFYYYTGNDGRGVFTLCKLPGGNIFAGGQFSSAGAAGTSCAAVWNGTTWNAVSKGFNDWVAGVSVASNGDIFACGAFSTASNLRVDRIGRWNGTSFAPVGADLPFGGFVEDAIDLPNGNVIIGGGFNLPRAGPFNDPIEAIARWDGSSWSSLNIQNAYVYAADKMPNGDIVAAGLFDTAGTASAINIARQSGSDWVAFGDGLGAPFSGDNVSDIAVRANGHIIACGDFDVSGSTTVNNIAEWDGTAWQPLGSGLDGNAYAMVLEPNGNIVVAGNFFNAGGTPANGVARWNGTTWSALGSGIEQGTPYSITRTANGDLYVGGQFDLAGGIPAKNIAKWNGTTWSAVDGGIDGGTSDYSVVYSLAVRPNGQVIAGGQFNRAGGQTSVNFAVLACPSSCPADVGVQGGGTGQDGQLDNNDFVAFINLFFAQDSRADVGVQGGGAGSDGQWDNNDFVSFINLFFAGC